MPDAHGLRIARVVVQHEQCEVIIAGRGRVTRGTIDRGDQVVPERRGLAGADRRCHGKQAVFSLRLPIGRVRFDERIGVSDDEIATIERDGELAILRRTNDAKRKSLKLKRISE